MRRAVLALLLVAFGARGVSIAAPPTAKELLERAKTAYLEVRVEASIRLLRRAAALAKSDNPLAAQIQLYLALNHLVAGREAEAEKAMARALDHDPALQLDPNRFKPSTVAQLEGVRRGLRGTLVVTANRPAVVWIDGRQGGATPLRTQVLIGYHEIEVRAGSANQRERVLIGVGKETVVAVQLGSKHRKADHAVGRADDTTAVLLGHKPKTIVIPPPTGDNPPLVAERACNFESDCGVKERCRSGRCIVLRPATRTWWFWTLVGVGVAGITAGITAAIVVPRTGPPRPTIEIR